MVVAVGSGERIATLLPELGGLFRHPLMTIAKVGLCKRDGQVVSRPETLPADEGAPDPAGKEPQVKLTVYTSEAARIHGQPAHREIVRLLRSAGVNGATSQRGTWGFHGAHAPHGDRLVHLGRHVPVVTTVIDRRARIGVAFDVIDKLTPDRGLVTAESVLTRQPADVRSDHGRLEPGKRLRSP
jgi:PII-like signaling protein